SSSGDRIQPTGCSNIPHMSLSEKFSSFPCSVSPHEYGRNQYTTKNETIPVKQSAEELTCFLRQKIFGKRDPFARP
ncbi:MAG: hypothetical protein PUC17_09510, partial [Anaerostipes sp.]|nr:hypothetical protein [Anaerostipes sp.]